MCNSSDRSRRLGLAKAAWALLLGAFTTACGAQRTAAVVATPPVPVVERQLTATRFVAFGDSMTEGFEQVCPGMPEPVRPAGRPADVALGLRQGGWSPIAYPEQLRQLLATQFPAQSVQVLNEGVGGEEVESGAVDLLRVLIGDNPEALLLLEGINSINARHGEAVPVVVERLRTMVRQAKARGTEVFVGTLLPQRPGGCRAYDEADAFSDVIMANAGIRAMVGEEGAVLVDLYRIFAGRTAVLIGPDGLHPTAEGYRVMADAYFAAIRRHLTEPVGQP